MANAMTDERIVEIRAIISDQWARGEQPIATEQLLVEVERLHAKTLTMEKALRIVDAIYNDDTSEDCVAIFERREAIWASPDGVGMHPREAHRQARAEFVLRVVNDE
jgi:hypothetical protein